jgi:hypothetical protein
VVVAPMTHRDHITNIHTAVTISVGPWSHTPGTTQTRNSRHVESISELSRTYHIKKREI